MPNTLFILILKISAALVFVPLLIFFIILIVSAFDKNSYEGGWGWWDGPGVY